MWGILFPGQGSQHQGMGKFLYEQFPVVKPLFEEASDTIKLNLKKLCFEGSEEDLALTENTQPAIVLVSYATFTALGSVMDIPVHSFAGHSVGEYSALAAAHVLSFSDAISLVRKRGQAMQSAVPVGKGAMMAVVGPSPDQVRDLCQWAEKETGLKPIAPANYNSPEQTVISGSSKIISWIGKNINSMPFKHTPKRLQVIPLKVSAPFHCSMMTVAEDHMRQVLEATKFNNSPYPIVQNYSAESEQGGEVLRENLIRQISNPVRWTECIEKFRLQNLSVFVESGPGKVLARLNKKIDRQMTSYNINSLDDLKVLEAKFG